ncbi:ATP12 family protein [Sphingomonas sp.]|uniref:ATP12 family chaperone protein n=1 Tax=Sphingomonas sp. TaxID=28214 RepID=UPI00286C476B|nr:ATP12 family protein [Sphingomonas sp.]
MNRFWTDAAVAASDGGWGVTLDGKPLRTPARAALAVPAEALVRGIVAEWAGADTTVDPRAMPLTGLANAAIDRVAPDPARFAADLAKYAEADLLCYRAENPAKLVAAQAAEWDPLLAWARRRFDVDFAVTSGIIHVAQPTATVVRLGHAVAALDPFRLAGVSPLVTIGGSLVAALAVVEEAMPIEAIWSAVSLVERWQIEQWGDDAEAVAALANRRADFDAAARFLTLLS